MSKFKKMLALLLAALTAVSAAACGTADDDADKYIQGNNPGKELGQTVAADDVFTLNCNKKYSMNPLTATNTNNQLVCSFVYENMVTVDNTFRISPKVVSEWTTTDGGSRWELKVEDGRKFHDGQLLTATDVAYSIQCAMRSDRFKQRLSIVAGCSAADSETVVVNLTKKNMQFPMLLTIPVIQYGTNNETYPGGSGPYAYDSDHNSMTAAETYKNHAALPVKTIYLKEYIGTEETISAFADSLIDLLINDPSANTNIGYGNANEIRAYNTTNMHYIAFNSYSSKMSNEYIRFAMNYAFDRDYVVSQLGGYALDATLPINPASSLYNESYANQFVYNLNKVQEILANAGLKDHDGDGFMDIKDGDEIKQIDIDFLVCSGSTVKVNTAKKFAEDMASLGLKVTVNKQDWNSYCERIEAGNYDMYYAEVRMTADFDPSRLVSTGASLNYGQFSDAGLEEAIGTYLAADDDGRKTACDNMCAYMVNKAFIIPLCFEKHQLISHRGVIEGIKVSENDPAGNVGEWTVKFENVQKKTDDKAE